MKISVSFTCFHQWTVNGLISRFIVARAIIRPDSPVSEFRIFISRKKKNIYPSIVGSFYNGSLRVYEPRQFQSVFQPATAHRIATRREDILSTETLLVSSIYNNLLVFFNCSFPAAINRWTSLSLNPKWRFLNRRLSRRDYCGYFLLRIIQELTRVFFSPLPYDNSD